MWYLTWILGLGLACALVILNALWHEAKVAEEEKAKRGKS
jgi:cyd operon protein YbgT